MKKENRLIVSVLLALLVMAGIPFAAFAESVPAISIPVEVKAEGAVPKEPENYTLVLTAVTPDAPMPEGSTSGTYTFQSTGAGKQNLSLQFPNLGVYNYTVTQKAGKNTLCTYDPSVFKVEISVVNSEKSEKTEINAVIVRDGASTKYDGVTFTNKYESGSTPPVTPKTGDESPVLAWAFVLIFSGLGLLAVLLQKKTSWGQ